jgi:hypothetical protein
MVGWEEANGNGDGIEEDEEDGDDGVGREDKEDGEEGEDKYSPAE